MAALKFANLTYEQVVHQYAQTVTGVCLMRLRNWADAEDCFQNTFLRLYTKSPDFKDENHLKAWLIRVAINECNNCIRKRRRNLFTSEALSEISFTSSDKSDISWALMRLSSPYREVLYLHYCEQYKVDEVASILGKKPNTVKTLLRRGREKLRSIYGGDEE